MASSFSDTASAEKVFLINFSSGFLKSTPSDRFNGRFIQPAIVLEQPVLCLVTFSSRFFLPTDARARRAGSYFWKFTSCLYQSPRSPVCGLIEQNYPKGYSVSWYFRLFLGKDVLWKLECERRISYTEPGQNFIRETPRRTFYRITCARHFHFYR